MKFVKMSDSKVLVEKLLRCTNVRRIYLLIRPKKGVQEDARLKALLNARLFQRSQLALHTQDHRVQSLCIAVMTRGLRGVGGPIWFGSLFDVNV
jgi:hypothetical protein